MVTRLFFLRSLRCTGIVLLGLGSSSCPCTVRNPFHQTVGKTTGLIYVSRPEVYTREHLVNERLDREAWLRKQLAEADAQTFGYQGLADTRSFQGWLSKTEAQVDPGSVALYLAQQKQQLDAIRQGEETATLQHSIDVALLQKQLTDVKSGATTAATPGPTPTATSVQTPAAPASNPTRPGGEQNQPYTSLLGLATALSPTPTGASASPLDLFRDRLAYRNEIYAQRAENSLDDAHDLNGNTLYQLTFNATIIPEDDTSHWAMIEVRIGPGVDNWAQLYEEWCSQLEQYLDRLALFRATLLADPNHEGSVPPGTAAAMVRFVRSSDFTAPQEEASTRPPAAEPSPNLPPAQPPQGIGSTAPKLEGGPTEELEKPEVVEVTVTGSTPQTGDADAETARLLSLLAADQASAQPTTVSPNEFQLSLCRQFTAYEFRVRYHLAQAYVDDIVVSAHDGHIEVVRKDSPTQFREDLERRRPGYAYAVTPKELVERISQVSSMRDATQVALGLGALLGAAKIGQFLEYARANEAAFQAIQRAPLVVGYSRQMGDSPTSAQGGHGNVFGWVLGPRFGLSEEGIGQLRHVVAQQPLTALVSLPSWWKHAKVTVTTRHYSGPAKFQMPKRNSQSLSQAKFSRSLKHWCPTFPGTRSRCFCGIASSQRDKPVRFSSRATTFGGPRR
jgi:hypothetical protein